MKLSPSDPGGDFRPRMWSKVDRSGGPDACWNFTGGKPSTGYGVLGIGGRQYYIHRLVYEIFIGPIPDGLEIDHLCRNRACCNPSHLEAVPHRINMLRAPGWFGAENAAKTHCPRGHALEHPNLVKNILPVRSCLECARKVAREFARSKRIRDKRLARASISSGC